MPLPLDHLMRGGKPAEPTRRLPPGACDCHVHVFEDELRFPFSAARAYTPDPRSVEKYRQTFSARGVDRAILVHPTPYGSDHSSFEYLLRANGSWMRGVAVVGDCHPDRQLETWHALGTRGTRLNVVMDGEPTPHALRELVARVSPLEWHVQMYAHIHGSVSTVRQLAELGVVVVLDHMGSSAADKAMSSSGLRDLLALMREGRAFVKLSAPYRISHDPRTFSDVRPLVDVLLAANPRQVLWGTDWPHPMAGSSMPTAAALIDAAFEWLPTSDLRQAVLVDNPSRLYWDAMPA
ncbi:amidohydrolase family protein [Pseudorhodoferax soli]|uniref:Putative TIM-barrel fold metal-dependent hydrolase n=1 Tax=Pseudorhodoferax soli TaxID=545864 RepID=A0A368XKQ3_9BURK|nr:amidohydrolase family protein [Pseudorhodoferax soli]RCW68601.1 putative TIM-barrel fold metal-dependent hydrolase [Pseudorhodoferax soli]